MSEAAATTTTAPAATTTAPAATTTAPAATSSWTDGFSPDLTGYISTKGFKSPADLADSYRNLEKLQGVPQDRILKLAEKMRDEKGSLTPEAREIYNRLGAPKEAKDYNLEIPAEYGDKNLAEKFKGIFHEEGIPKEAAERIVKQWNEYQGNNMKAAKEQAEIAFKNAEQNLKKEWGNAYEQNVNIAKEAVRTLGLDAKGVDAIAATLGHDKTMVLLKNLGSSVGEGRFIQGRSQTTVMEPTQAQYEIKQLMGDRDFAARLSKGDIEAKGKWEHLHKMAYPGDFAIRA